MSNDPKHNTDPSQPMVYQIRIECHLDDQWVDRFEGMTITLEENGDTLLTGLVVDQAALFGLLKKVRDLGMPLISVNRVEPGKPDMSSTSLSGIYAILFPGLGLLLASLVMRKGIFSKAMAYMGIIAGICGILAGIGPFFIRELETAQYINASLAMIWFFFVGLKLYKLGRQTK